MERKHLLFIVGILFFCSYSYAQTIDSTAVILDSKDTIKINNNSRSLINPRNLELKQKNYWEDYAKKTKKSDKKMLRPPYYVQLGKFTKGKYETNNY